MLAVATDHLLWRARAGRGEPAGSPFFCVDLVGQDQLSITHRSCGQLHTEHDICQTAKATLGTVPVELFGIGCERLAIRN